MISDNSLYNINVFIPLLLVSGRTRRRSRGWDNPGRRLLSLDLAFYTTLLQSLAERRQSTLPSVLAVFKTLIMEVDIVHVLYELNETSLEIT